MQKVRGRPKVRVAPCNFCNKQFKRQEHLRRHERTHTQEKPFSCSCSRFFSRQDLLVRHQRRAHPEWAIQPPDEVTHQTEGLHDPPASQQQFSLAAPSKTLLGANPSKNSFPSTHAINNRQRQHVAPPSSPNHLDRHTDHPISPLEERIRNSSSTHSIFPEHSTHQNDTAYNMIAESIVTHMDAVIPSYNTSTVLSDNTFDSTYLQDPFLDFSIFSDSTGMTRALMPCSYMHDDCHFNSSMDSAYENTPVAHGSATLSGDASSQIGGYSNLHDDRHAAAISASSPSTQVLDHRPDEAVTINGAKDLSVTHENNLSTPWMISAHKYKDMCRELGQCRHPLPKDFALPTRQTMCRYLEGYSRSFHPHLPFLHLPTASTERMSFRLITALAAVGAFYRFEHPQGYALYLASRAIIEDHLENERRQRMSYLTQRFPPYAKDSSSGSTSNRTDPSGLDLVEGDMDLETIQALLVLVQLTAWVDEPACQDAFVMIGWLAGLIRRILSAPSRKSFPSSWMEWRGVEELRRTLYCVFITSNLVTLCYNFQPILTNTDLDMPLPCSVAEWEAPNESKWQSSRRQGNLQHTSFRQCLCQLLNGEQIEKEISVTSMGNYLLVQGLLQQLYYERRSSQALLSRTPCLPNATVKCYQEALASWQSSWENSRESTLDPLSPYGPLAFNSTAIFRLVHIRLSVDTTKRSMFDVRDPNALARGFTDTEDAPSMRMPHVETAVLQCINVLRMLVRTGVAFIARTRSTRWSVQHAISSFECAILLSRWLQSIAAYVEISGFAALKNDEKLLLKTLAELIEETDSTKPLGGEHEPCYRVHQLAVRSVEIWAESCGKVHVFDIVHAIGKTLSYVAKQLHEKAASKKGV